MIITNTLNYTNKGWITGTKKNGIKINIHEFLHVNLIKSYKYYEQIIINEGPTKGTICIIPKNFYNQSYLKQAKEQLKSTCSVFFTGHSIVLNNNEYQTTKLNLTKNEKYKLGFPVRQENKTLPQKYFHSTMGGSLYANYWFPIYSKNNHFTAYLHFGSYSYGCITVVFKEKKDIWTEICSHILNCRLRQKYLTNIMT